MLKEMEQLENERLKEEAEIKAAIQKELKYAKYLEQQRDKLENHRLQKMQESSKLKKDEEKQKKKERQRMLKEQQEQEQKKKMIEQYKQKKLITEELLANADLDVISGEDNYGGFDNDGNESNEEEANAVMD